MRPTFLRFFKTFLLYAALLQALSSEAQTVTNVAGGGLHSLFLKSDGSLWAMGYSGGGELGDGTSYGNYFTNRPEQIVASGVTAIAAGNDHSLFLKSDGSLWAMGDNSHGELGDGTLNSTNRPKQIVANGVAAVAAGNGYSFFLKNNGSLWAMGWNYAGQLGDGTTTTRTSPVQIVASGVTAIAVGVLHSLFLKSDGSLWGTGNNVQGQLGDGTSISTNRPKQIVASGVTAIAAGDDHSLFFQSDGSLWAMGYNYYGQLGDGNPPSNAYQPKQIVATNVTAISAGQYHSLFLKNDGSLWAMGYNIFAQLGDGSNNDVHQPEQIVAIVPFVTSQPQPLTVTNGHAASFVVVAAGLPSLAYQWQFGGTNLIGATNTTLTLQNAFPANAGAYTVAITNTYGSVTSNPAMLTVLPLDINAPKMLTSHQFQFSFDTATGANYAVQSSTNLTQWFPFVTLGGIGVPLTLIDPNTAGSPQRFYRIIPSPQ